MPRTRHPDRIRHVVQPRGSLSCGQACVAMVAGVSLGAAIRAVGHAHGTHVFELKRALAKLGVECDPSDEGRFVPFRGDPAGLPPRAILWLRGPADAMKTHWAVLWDGRVYDPNGPTTDWPIKGYFTVRRRATS